LDPPLSGTPTSITAKGNSFLVVHPPCRAESEPTLRPKLRAARPVFSEQGVSKWHLRVLSRLDGCCCPTRASRRPSSGSVLRTTPSSMKILCFCLPGTRWWVPARAHPPGRLSLYSPAPSGPSAVTLFASLMRRSTAHAAAAQAAAAQADAQSAANAYAAALRVFATVS
jgi:hypothetical protein